MMSNLEPWQLPTLQYGGMCVTLTCGSSVSHQSQLRQHDGPAHTVVVPITIQITAPFVPILHQWLVEDSGLSPKDSQVQDQAQHLTPVNQSPTSAETLTVPLAAV